MPRDGAEDDRHRPSVARATQVLEVLRSGDPEHDAPLFWWTPETPEQLAALRTILELSAPAGSRDAVVDAAEAQGLVAAELAATLRAETEAERPLWADRDVPWVVAEVREEGASRTVVAVHPRHGRRDAAIEVVVDAQATVASWTRDEQDVWVGRDVDGTIVRTVRDLSVLRLDLAAGPPPWFVHDRVPHTGPPPEVSGPIGADDLRSLADRDAPLHEQRAAIRAALRERGVGDYAASVCLQHVRDGIVLREAERPGRSRLGGTGRLPVGAAWPRNGEHDEWCLTFLAELALDQLPRLPPLPPTGTLLLFQDCEMWGLEADPLFSTRAFYVPAGQEIVDAVCDGRLFAELDPKFVRGVVTARPGDVGAIWDDLPFLEDEHLLVQAATEELFPHEFDVHWLLGPRDSGKGSFETDIPCALEDAAPESLARFMPAEAAGHGWIHLLQLNGDQQLGLDFLGCAAHFYVLEEDLAACRFDRVIGLGFF